MEKIRPMLFTTLKKYSGAQLMSDVVAGIIVAIIALPLSIALALASGVGPEQGIYTAIAAGFVISFLGGSQVQIAGPTAAFATIVAGIVAKSGGSKILLIGNVIEQEFTKGSNWHLGSGLSLVLMIFILLSMALIAKYDKEGEGNAF